MKKRLTESRAFRLLKMTAGDFGNDRVLKMAAALAFSTLLALPALLIILLWVSSLFYDRQEVKEMLTSQLVGLLGVNAAAEISQVIAHSKFDYTSFWAKTLGIATLLLSATGIFGEIQDSINTIWGLRTRPKAGLVKIFINRLLSFSIIISLGFILVVSLVANALLSSFIDAIQHRFPGAPVLLFYLLDQLLMCGVLILLFGAIFKVLPDAKIAWRDVFFSAVATTILFMSGKYLIEYLLTHNRTVSLYGSAGSVIILLLWVYYSSVILYLGAEITQVWLKLKGRRIPPNRYAEWVEKKVVPVRSNTEVSKEHETKSSAPAKTK